MAVDALAGAISGCISRIVVGPLDVIKIRFQVQMATRSMARRPIPSSMHRSMHARISGCVSSMRASDPSMYARLRVRLTHACL